MSRRAAVGVRVKHPHNARDAGLCGPAAWVARECDRSGGRAVVAAVASDHLVAARVPARQLDRVLVCLGAAVREERHGEIARGDFGKELAEAGARFGRHRRADRAELLCLALDRVDDLGVAVTDRNVYELRCEVEVALAVVIPEVAAFCTRYSDGVDRVLHRPGVEDVSFRVLNNLAAQL